MVGPDCMNYFHHHTVPGSHSGTVLFISIVWELNLASVITDPRTDVEGEGVLMDY